MYIAQYLKKFKRSKNPLYLLPAVYLIVRERRTLEVIWSVYCHYKYKPSNLKFDLLGSSDLKFCLRAARKSIEYGVKYSREDIVENYNANFAVDKIPDDFAGARTEGILLNGSTLIIGEYANKSARVLLIDDQSCQIENYYNNISGFRHIHSIQHHGKNGNILINTGDGLKVLDEWKIQDSKLLKLRRIKRYFAGYTACAIVNGVNFFGTDFSSRPNYLETLDGDKFPMPFVAYTMFIETMNLVNNRWIVIVSTEHPPIGENRAISIFDSRSKNYVYCKVFNRDLRHSN